MSSLRDLLTTLEGISKTAEQHAGELEHHAQRLSRAATGAAAAARASARGEGRPAAQALDSAHRAVADAARLLHQAAAKGRGFVAHHSGTASGNSAQSSGPDSPQQDPELAWEVSLQPSAPSSSRYISPSTAQVSLMADALEQFGTRGIEGWIGAVNPNYSTQEEAWTRNCGPCARSVADAYQAVGVRPAPGDGKVPPGEYSEMWSAVGVQPSTAITNSERQVDPAVFSSSAYASLSVQLEKEGPGAVAIIGVDWDDPRLPQGAAGGHWLNAYVDEHGVAQWADGQLGIAGGWPPGYAAPIWNIEAVVRPAGGQPWKEVLL